MIALTGSIRNGLLLRLQYSEAVNSSVDCDLVYLLSLCKTIMTSFDFRSVSLEFSGKTPLSGCQMSTVDF